MNISNLIQNARDILQKAEKEKNWEIKALDLVKALDLLDSCSADDTQEQDREMISNIKIAHTRSMVNQLTLNNNIDINNWLKYLLIMITRLENEIKIITENDIQIKNNWLRFLKLYKSELSDLI